MSTRRGGSHSETYRGRSCYPFALQAAEFFIRRERDLKGITDVVLRGSRRPSDDRLVAEFEVGGGSTAEVEIAVARTGEAYRLTCRRGAAELRPALRPGLHRLNPDPDRGEDIGPPRSYCSLQREDPSRRETMDAAQDQTRARGGDGHGGHAFAGGSGIRGL